MSDLTPTTFLSADVARSADEMLVISFFNGPGTAVAILKGSETAALNLVWKVVGCLLRDNNSVAGNDGK